MAERTVEYFFDFVREHPEAFIVAGRELHGASTEMRRALRRINDDMASDMAADIRAAGLVPGPDDGTVDEVAAMIVRQLSSLSLEYLEQPRQRQAIVRQAVRFIVMLHAGALSLAQSA